MTDTTNAYFLVNVMNETQSGQVGGERGVLPVDGVKGGLGDVDMHHQVGSQAAVLALGISFLVGNTNCNLRICLRYLSTFR